MLNKFLTTAVLLGSLAYTQALKFALINDLHLNMTYDGQCNLMCYDKGAYGLDSPAKLIDTILEDIQRETNHGRDLDAIMIAGDFVVHGLSSAHHGSNNWP